MNHNELACIGIVGVGAAILVYLAMSQTGDRVTPQVQGEGQMMGMGVAGSVKFGPDMRVNSGTALDMRPEMHQWMPGYDPDPSATPVVTMRQRYPAVPGGNISTVMHRGFSAFNNASPADNDWRVDPPEAAVL